MKWQNMERDCNGRADIYYHKETEQKYSIVMNTEERTYFRFNERETPFLAAPFKVFYIPESLPDFRNRQGLPNDLSSAHLLAAYFNLSYEQMQTAITVMMFYDKKQFIHNIQILDDGELIVKLDDRRGPFGSFSSGEKSRIILDLVLLLSYYYSQFQSTILILERNAIHTLDTGGINRLLDYFRDRPVSFQFIFSTQRIEESWNTEQFVINYLQNGAK